MPDVERQADIALAITPSPFLADERVFPSLGVLKVAAALRDQGRTVDVLDLSGIKDFTDVMEAYLRQERRAPIVGLTATTPQFPHAVKLRDAIKTFDPDTRVILGGAHATMVGSAFLADQRKKVEGRGSKAYRQLVELFDTTVVGDGEQAVFETLSAKAPKVVNAGEKDSPFYLQRGTLDQYPFPARDLIDFDSYHYQIDGRDAQSMIAQLGCPFECGFCGGRDTHSFRAIRTRSIDSVIAEVDELVNRYGKEGIMMYDDELNVNPATMVPLMEELIRYQERIGKSLRFRGFVKAERLLEGQAELMYRAGFRVLLSGVESGDDGVLLTMKKHTTRAINSQWVKRCHDAGIQAKALMSIGHPGETAETINNSLEWVLTNRPDDVDWTIITQYPGSPYFDYSTPHPTKEGVWVYQAPHTKQVLYSQDVNFAEKAEYYKGIPGDYTSYVWTDSLTPEQLVQHRDRVEEISRKALGLPPIQVVEAMTADQLAEYQFGSSMGQSHRGLSPKILRSSK